MKLTKSALRQMIKEESDKIKLKQLEEGATSFDPEPRRETQQGEIEVMKGNQQL